MDEDRESTLRNEWFDTVLEFEYALNEHGYDAILDGEPVALRSIFTELRRRLATLETIGVDLATMVQQHEEVY